MLWAYASDAARYESFRDLECVSNLIQTVREDEKIVGVTGHIRADPIVMRQFTIPYLYQNAECTVGQYRRRLRQNLTSDLPPRVLSAPARPGVHVRRRHPAKVWILSQAIRRLVPNNSIDDERG